MPTKALKVGIMPREEYIKRTISIAKGEYKPRADEPKVWFESLQSLAQVLSTENQHLLKVILEQKPDSIKALEPLTGRKSSNLSRTLHTMADYGIVELIKQQQQKALKPIVIADSFKVEFAIPSKSRKGKPAELLCAAG